MALVPNQFLPLQIQRIDYQPPLEWSENPQCMMSPCDILYYRITDDQERAICPWTDTPARGSDSRGLREPAVPFCYPAALLGKSVRCPHHHLLQPTQTPPLSGPAHMAP
ncbi:unnamed protein product [Arctogadus glacialis]